jgi:pyrroline-5-carboxylate reductase
MQTIGFIGAGNMAHAIVSGLIASGYPKENLKISDINKTLLSQRKSTLDLEIFTSNIDLLKVCNVLVFAVKPSILAEVCQALKAHLHPDILLVSVVAGIKIEKIQGWLGAKNAVVRIMPNTPALYNQAMSGAFASAQVSNVQKQITQQILDAIGESVWLETEHQINAVTALSGSGPAYFLLMIEAMTKAGEALGLDKKNAEKLSLQTALGSSIMAVESNDSPQDLRAKVTSKGGTTQAAIASFQVQNFEKIISNAMQAAFDKSIEMSK